MHKDDKHTSSNEEQTEPRKKKLWFLRFPFPQILITLGLIMCAAPVVMHLYLANEASNNVEHLEGTISQMDPEQKEYLLEQAHLYNEQLFSGKKNEDIEILPYDDQLRVEGDKAMAWLRVPKAEINLPIYHGVSDEVLTLGAGHQPEFSLPVGGTSHVILSGHSGLKQQRMFDGIRALEKGDVFAIFTLGEPYAYRVDKWEIVEPDNIQIAITEGVDEVTLVTCTTTPDQWNPKGRIGINDKRLLVHGVRCEYDPAEFEEAGENPDMSVYINDNTRQAWLAGLILFILAIVVAIQNRKFKKRQRFEPKSNT